MKSNVFRWMVVFVMIDVLLGCTGHYYRNEADTVRIYLKAPQARQVEMMASFNGFAPLHAERTMCGDWMVAVPNDSSFTYFYRIDGQVSIPDCNIREQDDFGQFNCLFQHTQ